MQKSGATWGATAGRIVGSVLSGVTSQLTRITLEGGRLNWQAVAADALSTALFASNQKVVEQQRAAMGNTAGLRNGITLSADQMPESWNSIGSVPELEAPIRYGFTSEDFRNVTLQTVLGDGGMDQRSMFDTPVSEGGLAASHDLGPLQRGGLSVNWGDSPYATQSAAGGRAQNGIDKITAEDERAIAYAKERLANAGGDGRLTAFGGFQTKREQIAYSLQQAKQQLAALDKYSPDNYVVDGLASFNEKFVNGTIVDKIAQAQRDGNSVVAAAYATVGVLYDTFVPDTPAEGALYAVGGVVSKGVKLLGVAAKEAFPVLGKSISELVGGANRGLRLVEIDPSLIRTTQTTVKKQGETLPALVESMRRDGFIVEPNRLIDVVRMPDGKLTSLDTTRILAAERAGVKIQARLFEHTDLIPNDLDYVSRFIGRKGEVPVTYGDAIMNRVGRQNGSYPKLYPYGAPYVGTKY